MASLVIAGDDHALPRMFQKDLRAAEDMPCRNIGRIDAAGEADGLAIGDWRRSVASRVAQLHDGQRLGRGDGLPMPAARMIGMAVSHQRPVDRAAGIDPAIGRDDMNTVRFGLDPGEGGGGHPRFKRGNAQAFPRRCPLSSGRRAQTLDNALQAWFLTG